MFETWTEFTTRSPRPLNRGGCLDTKPAILLEVSFLYGEIPLGYRLYTYNREPYNRRPHNRERTTVLIEHFS